jgi:hypothetical protein
MLRGRINPARFQLRGISYISISLSVCSLRLCKRFRFPGGGVTLSLHTLGGGDFHFRPPDEKTV